MCGASVFVLSHFCTKCGYYFGKSKKLNYAPAVIPEEEPVVVHFCPACGNPVVKDSAICGHCQADIPQISLIRDAITGAQCPQCSVFVIEAPFCFNCGFRLVGNTNYAHYPNIKTRVNPGANHYYKELLLDRYELFRFHGEDCYGKVWSAYDMQIEGKVVIRILPPHFISNEKEFSDFYKKFESVLNLKHDNISRVYDVLFDRMSSFIIMECIDGLTLDNFESRSDLLPYQEWILYLKQICNGLDCAHKKGVYHGDIGRKNVMITPDREGTIKIINFGLYTIFRAKLPESYFKNRYPDVPPEVRDGREIGPWSDLYSIAYMTFKELNSPYWPLPNKVNAALLKALSEDPKSRFENILDFSEAVSEAYRP
jgi:hypothetical protein